MPKRDPPWLCCNCGDGPHNPRVFIFCPICDHKRCSSCSHISNIREHWVQNLAYCRPAIPTSQRSAEEPSLRSADPGPISSVENEEDDGASAMNNEQAEGQLSTSATEQPPDLEEPRSESPDTRKVQRGLHLLLPLILVLAAHTTLSGWGDGPNISVERVKQALGGVAIAALGLGLIALAAYFVHHPGPLRKRYRDYVRKSLGLKPADGFVRVRYRCCCGSVIWDDYPASMVTEARIQAKKSQAAQRRASDGSSSSCRSAGGVGAIVKGFVVATGDLVSGLINRFFGGSRPTTPDTEAKGNDHQRTEQLCEPDGLFLTCFPESGDLRPVLVQISKCQVMNDKEYFQQLRTESKKLQHWSVKYLVPRKVKAVVYARFQLLHDNRHVTVGQDQEWSENRLPPDGPSYYPSRQYLLSKEVLLFGKNEFLHYFRKPHDCCHDYEVVNRVPRKTDGALVHKGNGPVLGWGIQLVDGIDLLKFGIAGFVGLIVCMLGAVVWAKLRHDDVQGGFAISQSLTMVVTYIVMLRGMAED